MDINQSGLNTGFTVCTCNSEKTPDNRVLFYFILFNLVNIRLKF